VTVIGNVSDASGRTLAPATVDRAVGAEIVTSSWVALDFNQQRYLGTETSFEQVEGVTTKGILTEKTSR
jgi:hypothetical protein